jgi:putative selenate reductase FAD-binding subunit
MVTIQNYIRVKSLEEAYQLNQKKGSCIIGGMLWTKMQNRTILTAIDLCDLKLDQIEETENEIIIGSMVSLRQLELHRGLNNYTQNSVRDAVKDIVGVQFRNLATVGGSIWGRFGFSDVLTVFLAMDTYVELYQGGRIPLREFAGQKPDQDILVRLVIKKTSGCFSYASVRNQSTDFPVIACAASVVGGEYRLSVGARPGRAMLLLDEEGLLSEGLTEDSIENFAMWAEKHIPTGSNHRAGAKYRSRLIRVLSQRLLNKLREEQKWR